jgi:hypothetical protein
MLTADALYGVEEKRLAGIPLQARILVRGGTLVGSGIVAFDEIEGILSSGTLSRDDDVAEAYDVILGRW